MLGNKKFVSELNLCRAICIELGMEAASGCFFPPLFSGLESMELIGAMVYDVSSWKHKGGVRMGVACYFFFSPFLWIGLRGRDKVVCQHLDLDDTVPRRH